MRRQSYFIEPYVVGICGRVEVHLESDIDALHDPARFEVLQHIDVVGLISHGQAHVMHLIPHPLKLPYQVCPGICGKAGGSARHLGGHPAALAVPDIPRLVIFEIALSSKDPTVVAEILIHIELQRLWTRRIVNHYVHVVSEVAHS